MRWSLKLRPDRKYRLIVVSISIAVVLGTMFVQILLISKQQFLPERRFIVEEQETGKGEILNLSLEDMVFQDSRIITLHLEARGSPIRFDVSLESKSGLSLLPVYSAPVPFEREDEGRKILFSLGEHAPNPLALEIVVPENFEGLLNAGAVYNTWDPAIDPQGKPGSDDYVLTVSKVVDL